MPDLQPLAVRLDDAARTAKAIPQLAEPLSVEEAYQVQALSLARRYDRGERRVGIKMGFTSRAKMVQMGVSEMIWGRLADAMLIPDGGTLHLPKFVHPRVEPEVAFLLSKSLADEFDPLTVLSAIEGIAPALEVIDSRYEKFKFSVTDVIADNSSSSAFCIGGWRDPSRLDFSNLGLIMELNHRPVQIGSSAAILGHPLRSLQAAARLTAMRGEPLRAGDIVLAGGATAAESLEGVKHVRLEAEGLGQIEFVVSDS